MSNDTLPLSVLAQSRAQIYDIFSEFFTGKSSQHLVDSWSEIVRFLNGIETLCEIEHTHLPALLPQAIDLDRHYAKLFLGVGVRTVPLVASAYTNEHHMMCQEDCQALNELYRSYGFAPTEEWASFADSVAVELAFLALLARTETTASTQKEFLANRLIPLVSSVQQGVQSLKAEPIETIFTALLNFMTADKQLLSQPV